MTLDPWERLLHARGQSLPDWIALRSGRIGAVPDAVAFPETGDDVAALLAWARERDARLIPYGGGTSVAGHVNPLRSEAPVVTVDLSRLSRLVAFDETSRLATFGAGVKGPDLEAELRARGFTLGHFPQSFELSTLGGWVATRSSGQQSLGYGRIERLFAGGRVETPSGRLDLPPFPASAAGPDLRELVLGSEGRLGVLTEGTVRVSPIPAREEVHGVFLPDFPSAIAAVRDIAAMRLPLSMLRLSTPEETRTTLLLAGHERLIRALEAYLSLAGRARGEVPPPRRDLREREPREADAAAGARRARDARRRRRGEGVRPGVAPEPVPRPLPEKRPLGGGLGRRHARDGGSRGAASRRSWPRSRRRCGPGSPPRRSGSTPSPTSRTSTSTDRASTRRTSSASPPTPT